MERVYKDLFNTIPMAFESFSFAQYYIDEQRHLKPALEKLGYTHIRFIMGEKDSFGPLSRVCIAHKDGKDEYFVYG